MPSISRLDELEWHRRLAGKSSQTDLGSLHERLDRATHRFDGQAGISRMHTVDDFISPEPETFAARVLAAPLGEIFVFRMLITPCTSVRTPFRVRRERDAVDAIGFRRGPSITLSAQNLGRTVLRSGTDVHETERGQMSYVSGLATYAVDRPELTDTLGLTMPLSLIPDLAGLVADRPVQVLPDTAITAGAAGYLSSFLLQRIAGAPDRLASETDAQSALIGLVRSTLAPALRGGVPRNADTMRTAIDQHIEEKHRDPALSVESLAAHIGVSRRQLYRYVGAESLAQRIARRRAETARRLIEDSPQSDLDSIARQSGFSDANRLRTHFQRFFGQLPSTFRDGIR